MAKAFAALTGRPVVFGLASLPLVFVLILLAVVVWVSVVDDIGSGLSTSALTFKHFHALFDDPQISTTLWNTAGFAIITVITAMAFGVTAAWLVERTDLPWKKLVYVLMTVGLLLPTFFIAMGWVFLMHPRIGMVNRWLMDLFNLSEAPFNIATITGMGWVEGLGLASLAFVMTSPIFKALNPALEEASTVHGLGRWGTAWHVVLPLMWPALLAASIYIAVIAIATFEVPAIIGLGSKIFTFSTLVYVLVSPEEGVPNYGIVGALSMFLVGISIVLSYWYFRVIRLSHRYGVIEGRGYRPKMIPLGRLVWVAWGGLGSYFMLAKILPLLMMVWASLLPYFQPFSIKALSFLSFKNFEAIDWTLVGRGTLNTVILMLVVPTVAIIFGLTISWIVTRTKTKGRFIFDWIAFLPHAVPNLIFALAAILFALYVLPKSVPFYGTIFILMAIYILTRISLTTRVLNGSLLQIHKELEEAAYVSGMSTIPTMWKIVFPLIMPAVVNLWIWNALLTYRELTMAAFLVTQENITLPVVIWSLWNSGTTGEAAAVSLFFVATLVPLIAAYWGLRGRTEL
ncbi:MAG: ABC transporter permease [Alphaproteobacteria bacterium]|jgi:iron(III) transport system permease protein